MIKARQTKGGKRYDVRLRDPEGNEYSRTFATRKAAETFERSERTDRARGVWINPRHADTTLASWAAQWLASDPNKRPKTKVDDEVVIRRHLAPVLGSRPLGSITPVDVQRLVSKWAAECAPSSTHRRYAVLRAILNASVNADLIGRSPCRGIKLPAVEPTSRPVIGAEELVKVAEAIGPDYAPMVYVGAVLGLRVGEVLALRVGSLDLLRGTVSVSESVGSVHGYLVDGAPKSKAGRRTFRMPAPMADMLAAHLARRGLTAADAGAHLFTSPEGRRLRYGNWLRRHWTPAVVAAGLPGLQFHCAATARCPDGARRRRGRAAGPSVPRPSPDRGHDDGRRRG